MPITSFTRQQYKQLNTTMDKVMLNKYQLNRKMPKVVIYSPYNMGGMIYPSFLIIQDQMNIMNLLKQLRWNKTVANDFLVTLSAVQFTSGLCKPIFMETETDLSYVPRGLAPKALRGCVGILGKGYTKAGPLPKLARAIAASAWYQDITRQVKLMRNPIVIGSR